MNRLLFILLLSLFAKLINAQCQPEWTHYNEPFVYLSSPPVEDTTSWKLVFHDEFNGASLDTNKWMTHYPYGPNESEHAPAARLHTTRPNRENQIYRDDKVIVNNGILELQAIKKRGTFMGYTKDYEAGMIHSKDQRGFQGYTKYEIRCKIPSGSGFFPAFWFFGSVNEMGCFEFNGVNPKLHILGMLKWAQCPTENLLGKGKDYKHSIDLSKDFHTFALEHDDFFVKYYVDDIEIFRIARLTLISKLTPGYYMQEPAYPLSTERMRIIANLAIGDGKRGNKLHHPPGIFTEFPNKMEIDYIRVYQRHPQSNFTDLCKHTILGDSKISSSQTKTYQYKGNLSVASWTVSKNLTIVDTQEDSILVKVNSKDLNLKAWIRPNFTEGYPPCVENYTKNIIISF